MNITAIIPALNPDSRLGELADGLLGAGLEILIVNDGSREDALCFFPEHENITVLTHTVNKGKGAALKTAFAFTDAAVVVTVDADGQHLPKDALRVALNTVKTGNVTFGARDFNLPCVPTRSRAGNKFTRRLLRLYGVKLSDTQTGLRAFPKEVFKALIPVPGERFEYETNMLLALKKREIDEIAIETIYTGSEQSHFRSFRDSWRIFTALVRYACNANVTKIFY